ncbi:hypothetical protein, partial [Pseudomonas aeruginosa]
GIVDWYRENHARLAPETDAANQPHTNQPASQATA